MLFPTPQRDPALYPHRHGLYFAFFNALNWQVVIGTPTVLFLQQLGADSFQVGLVFAWTFLLTPVQVLATAWLPQLGFKRLALAGWSLRSWCLVLPLGLALLAPREPAAWMVHGMIVAMFVYSLTRAVGSAALTTWLYQLIPDTIRGRYWATDQILAGVAVVGSLLLYSGLFALLPVYPAFLILYLIAVAGAVLAGRQLRQLPDADRPQVMSLQKIVQETPRLMLTPGLFRNHLFHSAAFFIAITPITPFAAYYLKGEAGLPASQVLMLMALTYLGVILANGFMRSRLDRLGARPFFRLGCGGFGLIAGGWLLFLHFDGRWTPLLPLLYLLQGMASGCWTSANLHYLAKIVPETDRALPVSIHGAVITFLGGCSPVLWGLFLQGPHPGAPLNGAVFAAYFVVLLLSCGVLLGLLPKLPEKAGTAPPLLRSGWLLQPFRTVANLINLVERPERPSAEPDRKPPA